MNKEIEWYQKINIQESELKNYNKTREKKTY